MLMYCLIEKLPIYKSEKHQQKSWIINFKTLSDLAKKITGLRLEANLKKVLFTEIDGSSIFFCRTGVAGLSLDENAASNNFQFFKDFDFLPTVLVRDDGVKGKEEDLYQMDLGYE